jgi:hypothetical protein
MNFDYNYYLDLLLNHSEQIGLYILFIISIIAVLFCLYKSISSLLRCLGKTVQETLFVIFWFLITIGLITILVTLYQKPQLTPGINTLLELIPDYYHKFKNYLFKA